MTPPREVLTSTARSAASISSTVPSATDGAFAPGMFATAMPSRVAVLTSMVFTPGTHLVHEPELGRHLEVGTRNGPQHVPDHLGFGELPVERIVVILGAVPDVKPIPFWGKRIR